MCRGGQDDAVKGGFLRLEEGSGPVKGVPKTYPYLSVWQVPWHKGLVRLPPALRVTASCVCRNIVAHSFLVVALKVFRGLSSCSVVRSSGMLLLLPFTTKRRYSS